MLSLAKIRALACRTGTRSRGRKARSPPKQNLPPSGSFLPGPARPSFWGRWRAIGSGAWGP